MADRVTNAVDQARTVPNLRAEVAEIQVVEGQTAGSPLSPIPVIANEAVNVGMTPALENEPSLNPRLWLNQSIQGVAPLVVSAYLLGVFCFGIRLLVALGGGHRLARTAIPTHDAMLVQMVQEQARKLGLRFVPLVAYCDRVAVPTVVGWLRPVILIPASILRGLNASELEWILCHELAHIRRNDVWVNLLQRCIESVLFFHPAVWYVSRQVSQERELCCDDLVLKAGNPRMGYAGALLRMAELCILADDPQLAVLRATGQGQSELEFRIRRLMTYQQRAHWRLTRIGLLVSTILIVTAAAAPMIVRACTQVIDQQDPDSAQNDSPPSIIKTQELDKSIQWSTYGDIDGLLSGARVVVPAHGLKTGEPLVVEYRLANVSGSPKSIQYLPMKSIEFPTLERNNRLTCVMISWEDEPIEITLQPWEVYVESKRTLKIDTTGLSAGVPGCARRCIPLSRSRASGCDPWDSSSRQNQCQNY